MKSIQPCPLSQLHIFYMHCNKMEFNHDKQCRINSQFEILSRKIYRLNRICAFYASCMLRVINLMDKEWDNGAWYNGIKSITTQLVGFYSVWILKDWEKNVLDLLGICKYFVLLINLFCLLRPQSWDGRGALKKYFHKNFNKTTA